ncbi:MAG TPA: serine/threonine-protein kinase [Gemmataceae bacterium]
MIGSRLGDWVLDRELGGGAMGVVYKAHHAADPDRTAAVKVLVHDLARDPVFLFRFQSEIDLLRQLDHPNIVRFLESGIADGIPYLVMEYVPGRDLESVLRERGRIPWPEALDLALQMGAAVKHAHQRGVVHRDLKPSNMLLAEDGRLRLLDFGVAKLFGREPLTGPGTVVGTLIYVAPEQASGKPVTKRTDVYALGGVLYTLATGRPPFAGSSVLEVLHKHCFAQPERPSRIAPDLPHDLDELILAMLAKDPQQRPGDGGTVLKELERVCGKLERQGKYRRGSAAPAPADPAADAEPPAGPKGFVPVEMAPLPRPLMRRPAVVIPLFLLFVAAAAAIYAYVTGRPGAEELYARAAPLLRSDDPDDWRRAWDEYLSHIRDHYPGRYEAEVEEAERRVRELGELKLALARSKLPVRRAEGEPVRLYRRGLFLLREGDVRGAREVWGDFVRAFGGVEPARPWVSLAREGLDALEERPASGPGAGPDPSPRTDPALRDALRRVRELRAAGKTAEADAALEALRALYEGSPGAAELAEWMKDQTSAETE